MNTYNKIKHITQLNTKINQNNLAYSRIMNKKILYNINLKDNSKQIPRFYIFVFENQVEPIISIQYNNLIFIDK